MHVKYPKIVFIGCGNMGCSLIGGLITSGFVGDAIVGVDVCATQRTKVASRYNIEVFADIQQLPAEVDILVLAVKPQSAQPTLQLVQKKFSQAMPLIFSIMAGIKISQIGSQIGVDNPIVRAMPNIPVLVGAGATALFANGYVTEEQRNFAEMIMCSVGLALWVDHEALMDVTTALSGCAPAYYFLFMEVMEQVGRQLGLSEEQARKLTRQSVFGAAKMALASDETMLALRHQVTSPGGATEQALAVLTNGGMESLFEDALRAAWKRSIELSAVFEEQ